MNGNFNDKKIKKKKKTAHPILWGFEVLALSFILTVLFSMITEVVISDSSAIVCSVVLVVLLFLNIACDMIANAFLTCDKEQFLAKASRKIRGAKRAVRLLKNANKISSIFADIIGDICGIVSGTAGATLTILILTNNNNETFAIIVTILVSAVIGALTVGGKAFGKYFSMMYADKIVFAFSKFTTFFKKEK